LPDGPGRFRQGFTCPALLRSHSKEDCIFTYAAVTLSGRPFQTVRLTLSYPSFHSLGHPSPDEPVDDCGPATPGSPFELPGLGSSDFARHYFRNHGCFLFLGVLRWFTSPGSPVHPMDSDVRNGCSHPLGFPIRISPDHSLLAASRGFSQLIASFFAYLRQGIHTHALSSLTIKSTSHIRQPACADPPILAIPPVYSPVLGQVNATSLAYTYKLVFCMPVNIQLSKIDCFLKNLGVRS
jgi:hypothetical protein